MKTVNLLLILFFVAACGTQTPFQRGPKKDEDTPTPVTENATDVSEQVYMEKVFPLLERDCTVCHGNPAPNFARAKEIAIYKHPEQSPVLQRPTGHNHDAIWEPESAEVALITKWIMGEPDQP